MFPDLPQALTQIEAGRVRGLGRHRPASAPLSSTCPRSPRRCRAIRWSSGRRCSRRPRTPKPILQKLHDVIAEAIKDPATAKAMTQGRTEISPLTASTTSPPT